MVLTEINNLVEILKKITSADEDEITLR